MSTKDPVAADAAERRRIAIHEGLVSQAKLVTEKLVYACNRKDLVEVARLFAEGAELLADYGRGSVHVTHTPTVDALLPSRKVKP